MSLLIAFAAVVLRQYVARRRTYQLVWGVALAMFAVGAGCEVVGDVWGWTPLLARLYYLAGATLGQFVPTGTNSAVYTDPTTGATTTLNVAPTFTQNQTNVLPFRAGGLNATTRVASK